MKKLLFITLITAFFASCSEEPTTPGSGGGGNAITIEGTWNVGSLEQQNGKIALNGIEFSSFTMESSNESGTITFGSDGKVTSTDIAYTAAQTLTTAGIPNTTSTDIPATSSTGTYTYDEATKTLTIEAAGSPTQEATVTEMTATKLVYLTKINESTTTMGITSTTTSDFSTTLTR